MAVNLSPVGGVAAQFFTNTGAVLTGGKIYTYAAGTTTPAVTYTSSTGATPWANPIVLDAAGRVPGSGEIWLTDGINYKFVLKDTNDVLIATYDNVSGINSNFIAFVNEQQIITATANQTVFNLSIDYAPGTNSLSVFVDGVNQYGPGALYAYTETDSNTVTFNSGLHVGAEVKFTTSQQQGAGIANASQITYDPAGAGAVPTNVQAKLRESVSVLDFDADATGATDSSTAILAADATGYRVLYPKGTYKYTSNSNPTFAAGVDVDNATLNSTVVTDTLKFDADGTTLVGLHQNHLQLTTPKATGITNGVIVPPPVSTAAVSGPLDVIAHWYNDFGTQASSSQIWYDWSWNFVGNTGDGITSPGYDPTRHPLLGWYRGDDANVLDWQAYWLKEYGVTAVIPTGVFGTSGAASWTTPSNAGYWFYKLLTATQNGTAIRYIPWVAYSFDAPYTTTVLVAAQWTDMIYNVMGVYINTYTVQKGNNNYACIFLWDGEALRTTLGGTANTIAFLKARAAEAVIAGYDGLCVMTRNATNWEILAAGTLADLEANGVLYLPAAYESQLATTGTYTAAVAAWTPAVPSPGNWVTATTPQITAVATSHESVYPHPSGWTCTGSTPALFNSLMQKCIRMVNTNNLPRIVTVYNVAEWAEGGPGLQPDYGNGFGYLQAVKDALLGDQAQIPANGTWVPTLNFGGATSGITYTSQTGVWEKVGNQIIYHANIQLTSKGFALGTATITGLPFSVASFGNGAFIGSALGSNMTFTGTLAAQLPSVARRIDLFINNGGTTAVATQANFNDTTNLSVSIIGTLA
jgi:hypothetical protein